MSNERLKAEITLPTEDLNILIEITSKDSDMSQSKNSHPSPQGRLITASSVMNDDRIVIEGWINSSTCEGVELDTSDVIPRLKRVMERQKYQESELATIVTNDEYAINMMLISASISRAYESPQEMTISLTWEAVNMAGTITEPNFSIGGIQ